MSVYTLDSAMDDGTSKYMLDGNWSFFFVSIHIFDLILFWKEKNFELAKKKTDKSKECSNNWELHVICLKICVYLSNEQYFWFHLLWAFLFFIDSIRLWWFKFNQIALHFLIDCYYCTVFAHSIYFFTIVTLEKNKKTNYDFILTHVLLILRWNCWVGNIKRDRN